MIKTCPHCNKEYVVSFDSEDYIHTCNSGNLAIDEDDVVVVGNWVDSDGTSGTKSSQAVMTAGVENELFGTRVGRQGIKKNEITPRDNRTSTHRQIQHEEFIEK